jgi:carbamoyl-phosphate synthase large subunit
LDVLTWSERSAEIQQSGVQLLLNNPDLIRLCDDKWLFYQHLVSNDSPYAIPTTLDLDDMDFDFPLLLKPRHGSGSRGISIVGNIQEFQRNIEGRQGSLMIQPVVGNEFDEYTTSGFFGFDSTLHAHITLRRKLSSFGFTETAEVVELDGIEPTIIELSKIFCPVGPTNFQFRLDGGQLKLLEINPRISSTTSIRTAFGFNECSMGVDLFLNNTPPVQPPIRPGRAYRYVEDLIYYDGANI